MADTEKELETTPKKDPPELLGEPSDLCSKSNETPLNARQSSSPKNSVDPAAGSAKYPLKWKETYYLFLSGSSKTCGSVFSAALKTDADL